MEEDLRMKVWDGRRKHSTCCCTPVSRFVSQYGLSLVTKCGPAYQAILPGRTSSRYHAS